MISGCGNAAVRFAKRVDSVIASGYRANDVGCVVRRAIVNNDYLDGRISLRKGGFDRFANVSLTVVDRYHDGNERLLEHGVTGWVHQSLIAKVAEF